MAHWSLHLQSIVPYTLGKLYNIAMEKTLLLIGKPTINVQFLIETLKWPEGNHH